MERSMKSTQFAINYMQLFEAGFDLFDIEPADGTRFAVADEAAEPTESRSRQRVAV